jgi:hypothetical protein
LFPTAAGVRVRRLRRALSRKPSLTPAPAAPAAHVRVLSKPTTVTLAAAAVGPAAPVSWLVTDGGRRAVVLGAAATAVAAAAATTAFGRQRPKKVRRRRRRPAAAGLLPPARRLWPAPP